MYKLREKLNNIGGGNRYDPLLQHPFWTVGLILLVCADYIIVYMYIWRKKAVGYTTSWRKIMLRWGMFPIKWAKQQIQVMEQVRLIQAPRKQSGP